MNARLEIMVQSDGAITSHAFADRKEIIVGRSSNCDLQIEHATVSRRHASFALLDQGWTLQDLASSHGTWLNGRRIGPAEEARIGPGDVIQIRPWSLIIRKARSDLDSSVSDDMDGNLVRPRVQPMVKRRLAALLDVVSTLQHLDTEVEIADRIVQAVLRAAEVDRAAIVQLDGDELEPITVRLQSAVDEDFKPSPLSRTLVKAAMDGGEPVRLDEYPEMMGAESLANAGLSQALCVPIDLGHGAKQVLYADAWRGGLEDAELVAWCEALAHLHEVAIGNHRRELAEQERSRLFSEMASARAAQELLLPVRSDSHGLFTWSVSASPGLEVAGDLVDIAPTDDGGLGLMVGDVAGKGARAGIVMASIQAYAHAIREKGGTPTDLLEALDGWAKDVVPEDLFVTLWCARLSPDGRIDWVDAGHGMSYRVRASGELVRMGGPHRPPVGVAPAVVEMETMQLEKGDSLVIMTDGVVEQSNPAGEQFGYQRLEAVLSKSVEPHDLVEEVRNWAGTDSFDDDMTVVSIGFARR